MTIKLNNLRNQERDTMRTALTVMSSLAATRAEIIEAEQERLSEVIADAVKQEDALDEVHQALEQALRARGINTAGPTKELVTRLAESGASIRQQLEDGLAWARAELEAESERHEATRSELECVRRAREESRIIANGRLCEARDEANALGLRLGTAMRLLEGTAHELMDQPWRDDFAALQQERAKCKL